MGGSLLCSQQPATCAYFEPDRSNPHPSNFQIIIIIIIIIIRNNFIFQLFTNILKGNLNFW